MCLVCKSEQLQKHFERLDSVINSACHTSLISKTTKVFAIVDQRIILSMSDGASFNLTPAWIWRQTWLETEKLATSPLAAPEVKSLLLWKRSFSTSVKTTALKNGVLERVRGKNALLFLCRKGSDRGIHYFLVVTFFFFKNLQTEF